REKAENVVNPPSTPEPRNGRTSGCAHRPSPASTISTPISAQPPTLMPNSVHGNPPGEPGKARVRACRAIAPAAPPAETAASTLAVPGGDRRGPGSAAGPPELAVVRAEGRAAWPP